MAGKRKQTGNDELDENRKNQGLKIRSPKNRRPYGLLSSVGISGYGMTPGEAWDTWNDYQKGLREKQKPKKHNVKRGARVKNTYINPQDSSSTIIQIKTTPATSTSKSAASRIKIPELNADQIYLANANSQYDRGTVSERDYKAYAQKILGMDISDSKKEKLLGDLKKRWDKLLGYQADWVPWTVAGPARYNAKKLDKADQVMRTRIEIVDWFKGVEKSVKNSQSQYLDDERIRKAKREEEWLNRAIESGWYTTPTSIANGIAAIAPHDPERFVELYEEYDKKYHFRKGTNAAKLYEQTKAGKYKGEKRPQKLHETDNLNTYKKNIQAGERVFMKFTTRPKPQLIFALKKRGWHWNANEEAWSIDSKKYDPDFVSGIDKNYKKYL